ncbi:MAG: hypothetical protein ACRD0K_10565 [Egibacteraceae bacterium]
MDAFFPLSGDVTQTFNPWAIWLRSANQQLGFITINQQRSSDPEIERRIVEEVAPATGASWAGSSRRWTS